VPACERARAADVSHHALPARLLRCWLHRCAVAADSGLQMHVRGRVQRMFPTMHCPPVCSGVGCIAVLWPRILACRCSTVTRCLSAPCCLRAHRAAPCANLLWPPLYVPSMTILLQYQVCSVWGGQNSKHSILYSSAQRFGTLWRSSAATAACVTCSSSSTSSQLKVARMSQRLTKLNVKHSPTSHLGNKADQGSAAWGDRQAAVGAANGGSQCVARQPAAAAPCHWLPCMSGIHLPRWVQLIRLEEKVGSSNQGMWLAQS
jgi:hypothetical protein